MAKRQRTQNEDKRDIGTREVTIKKIELIGEYPEAIQLTFEDGTGYSITRNRYNSKKIWELSKCLTIKDEANVEYDKSSGRIIGCYIKVERDCPNKGALKIEPDWENKILTIYNRIKEKKEEIVLDSSVKYLREFYGIENTLDEVKALNFNITELIFISGRLAGVIGW